MTQLDGWMETVVTNVKVFFRKKYMARFCFVHTTSDLALALLLSNTLFTKLTMARAGWSGSCSANT